MKTRTDELLNTRLWECKCGELEEISNAVDIEFHVCQKCKRAGCWIKQF